MSQASSQPGFLGRKAAANHAAALPALERGKVGMICFLCSEAAFFGTLLVAYVTYLGQSVSGPTPEETLRLPTALVNTVFLVTSSITVALAARGFHGSSRRSFFVWLAATAGLGLCFLAGTAFEWADLIGNHGLTLGTNLFGTTFFTLIGFHATHVAIGILIMLILAGLAAGKRLRAENAAGVELFSWYWHFVDGVWLVIVAVVYVFGR